MGKFGLTLHDAREARGALCVLDEVVGDGLDELLAVLMKRSSDFRC
jgi:hypothetical protein